MKPQRIQFKKKMFNSLSSSYMVYPGMPIYSDEQAIALQLMIIQKRREYQQKMLEKHYPVKFIIWHSIVMGSVCVALIVLEIFKIINQYPLYYVGVGIWVAAYLIVAILMAILVSEYIIKIKS